MRLILIGCEYSGTSTLALAIRTWAQENLDINLGSIHDHWKIPHTLGHYPDAPTGEEKQQFLNLSKRLQEAYQRHNLYYHSPCEGMDDVHQLVVGYYIEDTIYARLYHKFGGPGEAGDREVHSKKIEDRVVRFTPSTILILVKASLEVIAKRMDAHPHDHALVKKQDIQKVSDLFASAFQSSRIKNKFVLDTSAETVEQTVARFAEKVLPGTG